ncbi:MAG: hypothetical protein JXQ83_02970 [Candidatus Glassbacteria bacterium]|nr:hypothetical protein [Candidatus Glassbacteria bacterium]
MSFGLPRLVFPAAVLVLLAVSGPWEARLAASPEAAQRSLAQAERRGRRPDAERMRRNQEERFEELCKYLSLTDEQKGQARSFFDAHNKNAGEVFRAARAGDLEREAVRDSMAVLMQNYRDQLRTLLSEEQKAKLDEWLEQHRPENRGRRPGGAIRRDTTPGLQETLAGILRERGRGTAEVSELSSPGNAACFRRIGLRYQT